MATILVNGCFDLLHEGHIRFLQTARRLGECYGANKLVVAINSDESARALKSAKWGEKYPIDDLITRCKKLGDYADQVVSFATEEELRGIIEFMCPCVICKGPDYVGQKVTGDDLAPVIILDTPEPDSVKQLKIQLYGQAPNTAYNSGTVSG